MHTVWLVRILIDKLEELTHESLQSPSVCNNVLFLVYGALIIPCDIFIFFFFVVSLHPFQQLIINSSS